MRRGAEIDAEDALRPLPVTAAAARDRRVEERERVVDRADVRAAALHDVGVLGGAATERLRRVAAMLGRRRARVDAVLAHRDREPGLGAVGAEARRARRCPEPERVACRDRERAELVGRQPVAPHHDDAVDRVRRERRRPPRPPASRRSRRRARPASAFTCSSSRSTRSGSSAGATCSVSAEVAQLRPLRRGCASSAPVAGDRLDAAQVGADRPLAHDLDRADEAERVHVGAAAELDRVLARLEHAHEVAVLVAEERDRAERLGVLLGRLVVAHRRVGDDLGVGERLDPVELVAA